MRDLFLSHSSADKPVVRKIASDVQAHEGSDGRRLTVWLDEAEIGPGQSIPGAVNAGLKTSPFFWSITWKPFRKAVLREVAGRRQGPKGEFDVSCQAACSGKSPGIQRGASAAGKASRRGARGPSEASTP